MSIISRDSLAMARAAFFHYCVLDWSKTNLRWGMCRLRRGRCTRNHSNRIGLVAISWRMAMNPVNRMQASRSKAHCSVYLGVIVSLIKRWWRLYALLAILWTSGRREEWNRFALSDNCSQRRWCGVSFQRQIACRIIVFYVLFLFRTEHDRDRQEDGRDPPDGKS